jgi:small subunit ribosomal protein S10|tara:strand:+ start:14983 stop:15276 length:294 start_codon:yes stop_codon:yes gene_type:complete
MKIKIKSIDQQSLKIYLMNIKKILKVLKLEYNIFNLPTKQKLITLLKSPHVNKTAREQFKIRTYKTIVKISNFNKFKILKLLSLNKPKTITLSIKNN